MSAVPPQGGPRHQEDRALAESGLAVVTKAKDLCPCIMTVTQKSPKHFRFTLDSRLQDPALPERFILR